MLHFLVWYITVSLLGLLTFPLVFRLFPALSDRGYSLSRALGLLLWGFIFWLLVSFGILRNEVGGLLFSLFLIIALSSRAIWAGEDERKLHGNLTGPYTPGDVAWGERWAEIPGWLKKNVRYILSIEVLFIIAFAAWAFVRANNPETTGTEKPMEIAFINAIIHSPTFPPHDPWLSGYAISYYYFGYVLAAMLAMFTSTNGGITFNLMLSLVFALSVIGSYGLLYNLLVSYWERKNKVGANISSMLGAFFAPLFLVLIGNAEGFLELLRAYGFGWSNSSANLWTWLNMKDLSEAPTVPYTWNPRFWFWWRASRVVHDYDLRGNFIEVIDEFPFFSYLLGDLHPHVLAMPFGLLALAIAFNLYLGGWQGVTEIFGLKIPVRKQGLALIAVVLGGLAFLNTWDFPVYLAVISGAFLLLLVRERGWGWYLAEELLKFSIPLAFASIALYLPFYFSFSSQAGGILPNIIFPTRGAYLWIMFAPLLVPQFLFIFIMPGKSKPNWKIASLLIAGLVLALWAVSTLLGLLIGQTEIGASFITSQGFSSVWDLLSAAAQRRMQYGAGLLTLVLLVGGALAYLFAPFDETETELKPQLSSRIFVLMLVVLGGLLVLAPEFVYLRDQFGSRMNTVFKFYYQAWLFWSLAASFGCVVCIRELRGLKLGLFLGLMTCVLFIGLTYPVLALPNKTDNFGFANPERRTLDGSGYLETYHRDDNLAIQWLSFAQPGVVAEAVGGSYSEFARVSTYSGQPSVLGWPGHESQWRGGAAEMGGRADELARLYTTPSWNQAKEILQNYNIRYVYIGSLERATYAVDERKFLANLTVAYKQGQVVIYENP